MNCQCVAFGESVTVLLLLNLLFFYNIILNNIKFKFIYR
jgi:hypothetical protein